MEMKRKQEWKISLLQVYAHPSAVLIVFQPKNNLTIKSLKASGPSGKTRNFQPSWYTQFPWISVCVTRKSVFCLYCRYAEKHHWLSFSRCGENVFTPVGFQNWKKAIEKFKSHEGSHFHREAQRLLNKDQQLALS